MRSFLRSLFRRRPKNNKRATDSPVTPTTARAMSTGAVAAALYTCTFSKPAALGAVPEDAEARAHHLKGGNGFANPWESCRDMNTPKIAGVMLWYVGELGARVSF